MNAKHLKRWLRKILLLVLIGSAVLWVMWIFLPHLLNTFINRKLASTELEGAKVTLSDVSTNTLHLEHAQFAGRGWSLQIKDTDFHYGLRKLIATRHLDSIHVGDLELSVVMDKLDSDSENTLSLEILKDLPVGLIDLANVTLNFETEQDHLLQSVFSGHLFVGQESGVTFELTRLAANLSNSEGDSLIKIPELSDEEGLFKLSSNPALSQTQLELNLPPFDQKSESLQITGASLSATMAIDHPLDSQGMELINQNPLELLNSLTGSWFLNCNQLSNDTMTAEWIALEAHINPKGTSEFLEAKLLSTIGILGVADETLEQLSLEVSTKGDLNQLQSAGSLDFLFDGIDGEVNFSSTAENLIKNPSLKGEYMATPIVLDYSDVVARRIPSLGDLSISGTLSAKGNYQIENSAWDATTTISFTDGSATMPSSELTVTNINFGTELQSLRNRTSVPGTTRLTMESIRAGDIDVFDTKLTLDLSENQVVLSEARSSLFNGEVTIVPGSISLAPLRFDNRLQFERLSLESITDKMAFFDGSMEGQVSGFLPLGFQDGKFQFGEGLLTLSKGSSAHLRYNTEGLFQKEETTEKPGFIQRLSDQIMGGLRLAPETVVEDALSNLSIHTLRIELLPEESPETPVRIRLGGEGKSGNTVVPFNLDTNINGTLDELVTFLLRMNSLGTPSL